MESEVYELLDKLGIEYKVVNHPPLFTYEDAKKYNIKLDAVICKSLFIRNKDKSQYYVFALPIEKKIDLKSVQKILKETRLSFGDENALEEKLGVKSGSVSIFNAINMKEKDVTFILDEEILNCERVAFHPNINTITVILDPKEISKILEFYNIKYKFIVM